MAISRRRRAQPPSTVAAGGSGINTTATVVTGNATVLSANDVTLVGNVSNTGWQPVSLYGFRVQQHQRLNSRGTKVPASNPAAGNFSTGITGPVQGATYYRAGYEQRRYQLYREVVHHEEYRRWFCIVWCSG